MQDPMIIAIVAAAFLFAGLVKGVVGLGLPTVALALLTATVGLPQAMALLLAPAIVTNIWQGAVGGHFQTIFRRLWPFLVIAIVTVWAGVAILASVEVALVSMLFGVFLAAYSLMSLRQVRFSIRRDQEPWLGPVLGVGSGMMTGLTGSAVPGVLYLQAIGLPRDILIQAMGVLFTLSTGALALALGSNDLLTAELGIMSVAAVVPAILGMVLGQKVRKRMPEAVFRRALFLALLGLGIFIVLQSAM